MSQYRDDREAAHLRIQNLEARLAEQEAVLARRDAALAERDDEIERLERVIGSARGRRSIDAAWASRVVGLAGCFAVLAAGAGVSVLCSHPAERTAGGGAPPVQVWVIEDGPDPGPSTPLHADPAPLTMPVHDLSEVDELADPFAPPARRHEPALIPRHVEPRVWGQSVEGERP
jgi:hypothetical protein